MDKGKGPAENMGTVGIFPQPPFSVKKHLKVLFSGKIPFRWNNFSCQSVHLLLLLKIFDLILLVPTKFIITPLGQYWRYARLGHWWGKKNWVSAEYLYCYSSLNSLIKEHACSLSCFGLFFHHTFNFSCNKWETFSTILSFSM